ncbi:MAG: methylamine utilization protein MauJ [Pseudomonadota bacterium]
MKIKIGKYSYTDKADYFIDLIGIHGWNRLTTLVDSKYLLYHIDPGCSVAVLSPVKEKQLLFSDVLFYANCLAYEHEIPTHISYVNKSKFFIHPSIMHWKTDGSTFKYGSDDYQKALKSVYDSLVDVKHSVGMIKYKYDNINKLIDIPYTNRYGKIKEVIALYASALRQVDPLSEYLNYYRILECISDDNGKKWIEANINKIHDYDFGFLEISVPLTQGRRKNLFSIYKRRAVKRINKIKCKNIAEYLYSDIRCGIAHSKRGSKVFDFDTTMSDIGEDCYIVKLLARIAIESMSLND